MQGELKSKNQQISNHNIRLASETERILQVNEKVKQRLIDENKEFQLQLKLENQNMTNKLKKENEELFQTLQFDNSDITRKLVSPINSTTQVEFNKKNPMIQQIHSFIGHTDPIKSIVVSQDETIMLSGDEKGHIIQWNLLNKFPHHYSNFHSDIIWSIKLSVCGKYAYTFGGDGTICKFNIVNRSFVKKFNKIHDNPITCAEVLFNDKYIVTGESDGSIKLLRLDDDMDLVLVKKFDKIHQNFVSAISATSNCSTIVSSSSDSSLVIWNDILSQAVSSDPQNYFIKSNQIIREAHKGTIWSCMFGKKDRFVYSTGADMAVKQWYLRPDKTLEIKSCLAG